MTGSTVFIPGTGSPPAGLLSRYLLPIPEGIASTWLKDVISPGSWILEPFGSNPWLIVEAARAGFKVLVAANNPVIRFLIELAANPPTKSEMRSALAELAAARSGDERLESHLKNLYATKCPGCGQPLPAHAFLWEKDARFPYARIVHCESCGESGEYELVEEDIQRLSRLQLSGMHRARALERIAPSGDPDREHAEEALNAYLPRAIYALVALINRLEGLISTPHPEQGNLVRRMSLWALALSAFDQGNVLWSHLSSRPRPRLLSASPKFRENNIWYALEDAVTQFPDVTFPLSVTRWPDPPESENGIVIFEGPLRELSQRYQKLSAHEKYPVAAALAVVPRPNQAFWTLSALWAGWLWGREAVGPFKSVLRRRRYDWAWHCTALELGFSALQQMVDRTTPILGLVAEAEANFLTATMVAACQAGFVQETLALRPDRSLAQIHWRASRLHLPISASLNSSSDKLQTTQQIVVWARNHLKERGEPAPHITLHAGGLSYLIATNLILPELHQDAGLSYSKIDAFIKECFTYKFGFLRFGGGEKSPETGMFWHNEIIDPAENLMDRVETAFLQTLIARKELSIASLDQIMCEHFPGLFTPPRELIDACIQSYCDENMVHQEVLTLRSEDLPEIRQADLKEIQEIIARLGRKLGYQVSGEHPILWQDINSKLILVFYLIPSAKFSQIIQNSSFPAQISVIVIPGARANLVFYKIQHDPLLRIKTTAGWRFIKFRHLRSLAISPSLTSENIDEMLGLDPLTEAPAQLRLL